MEHKMIAIYAAIALAIGAMATYGAAQSVLAIDQTATSTASNEGSNSADSQNQADAQSTGSGNANSGDHNGNTKASAFSDTEQAIVTVAKVKQRAHCDNTGNAGLSGNSC
jgi:hypothetical protein